jgi:hypothetical protein
MKSKFFTDEVKCLGLVRDPADIRPSAKRLDPITDYPTPTDTDSLEAFLYMLPRMKSSIPGHADICQEPTTAVLYKIVHVLEQGQSNRDQVPIEYARMNVQLLFALPLL